MARDSQDIQTVRLDTEAKLIRELAKKPCPCKDLTEPMCEKCHRPGSRVYGHNTVCLRCGGSGLAFEWASEPCYCQSKSDGSKIREMHRTGDISCRGSGRVPKALTSNDLWEHGIWSIQRKLTGLFVAECLSGPQGTTASVGEGETPTLAALKAVLDSGSQK